MPRLGHQQAAILLYLEDREGWARTEDILNKRSSTSRDQCRQALSSLEELQLVEHEISDNTGSRFWLTELGWKELLHINVRWRKDLSLPPDITYDGTVISR